MWRSEGFAILIKHDLDKTEQAVDIPMSKSVISSFGRKFLSGSMGVNAGPCRPMQLLF